MATNAKLTAVLKGKTIDSVRQREAELDIDFEDGTTLSVVLATSSRSVTVRSEDDKEVYNG